MSADLTESWDDGSDNEKLSTLSIIGEAGR
jgi:hypothetical protein